MPSSRTPRFAEASDQDDDERNVDEPQRPPLNPAARQSSSQATVKQASLNAVSGSKRAGGSSGARSAPSSNVRPSFSKDRQYSSNSSNSSTHADLTPYRSSSADALNPTGFPSGSSRSHMTSNHSPPSSPQSSSTKAARINFSGTGTSDDSSSAPFSNFQQRYRKHASQSSVHPLGSGRGYDDPDKNYWAMGLGDLGDQDSDDDENLDGRPAGPGFMKGFSGAGVGVRKFVGVTGKSQGVAPIGSSIPHYFPSSKDPSSSKSHHHDHLSGTISPSTVSDLVSNPEGRERLEWQTMLSSVLSGEVLRSEKTRIGGERPTNEVLRNEMGSNLWWGIRAILRGRGPAEEEKRVGQRRERTVDAILEEVSNFCVVDPPPAEPATSLSTDTSSTPSASTPSGSTAPTSIANLNIPSLSPESTSTPLANPDSTPTGPAAHGIDSAASPIHPSAFDQVLAILAKLSHAESLYPHCRALRNAKPLYDSEEFQKRVEALVSWSNVVLSLRTQIGILVKWTGSEELDVKKVDSEEPIRGAPGSARGSNQGTPGSASSASAGPPSRGSGISSMTGVGEDGKPLRPPTFVERVMKEDSLQRTFEKKTLSDLYALISSAKSTYLQHSEIFQKLNLPPYQTELTKLISFPMQLMEESLKVRLAYALKLEDPTVIVIDQLTEDFRLGIALACTIKKQYGAVIEPDEDRKWVLSSCVRPSYDEVLLESLRFFFRLLHWKLKSGSKAIYFRETEILEAEWDFLNESAEFVPGGDLIVAEQFCSLTKKLMVRVINYFETTLHVPSSNPKPLPPKIEASANGTQNGPHQTLNTQYVKKAPNLKNRTPSTAYEEEVVTVETKTGQDGKVTTTTTIAEKMMTPEERIAWFAKILDAVRVRYRKLQRFARRLTNRFDNSAEYSLEDVDLDGFLSSLYASGHFLIYTGSFEEEGTYIVADRHLRNHPEQIRRLLERAFSYDSALYRGQGRPSSEGYVVASNPDEQIASGDEDDSGELSAYILIMSPNQKFFWQGAIMNMPLPWLDLDMRDHRVRLVADGPAARLVLSKTRFGESLLDPETGMPTVELECIVEQQAHRPTVQQELRRIGLATIRLSEAIVESVSHVRTSLSGIAGSQELIENWFAFASDHGQRVGVYMDHATWSGFSRLLMLLAIDWVSFISEDCDPTDHKTFRWTVNALEFAMVMTRGNNILHLERAEFALLQEKVASCMALLISHFDILGARSSYEAKREQDRLAELRKATIGLETAHDDDGLLPRSSSPTDPVGASALRRLAGEWNGESVADKSVRISHEARAKLIQQLEEGRSYLDWDMHVIGRVVNSDRPEDRSLVALAASSSNISIHWQQGRFIGAGAYGKVYTAHNMDQNTVMAVKEIRFSDVSNLPSVYKAIRDESTVMQMLNHVNVVEYYGIEVHRDKVYIFQEYCDGGSLKDLLEHGRVEQEEVIMNYACQILEGLAYLHGRGIVHRDIKPDNVLLTSDAGIIKLVDFGAAKILARGNRTINRTRAPAGTQMNSLQGTPMYMSPEVIKNSPGGRLGAMDIWSVGCVVLELATGKKPWHSAENEWAIMYKIGAGELPPLPDPDQISEAGVDFVLCTLTMNAEERPTADELLNHHPWMTSWIQFRHSMGEGGFGDQNVDDEGFDGTTAYVTGGESFEQMYEEDPVVVSGQDLNTFTAVIPEERDAEDYEAEQQ